MYTKFYNLKEKPFNLTPDPRFLYLGESHREALAHLVYTVRERKGFMVMTGEVGTGKTTLIRALLRKLDANIKTVFIFNPILDVKDFFRFVCFDLGIQTKDQTKGNCLLETYQFLIESYRENRTVVMIIDEAHNLNPFLLEEIRLLSNFETSTDKLIQIILVGQPELNSTLNQSYYHPLKQRINFWFYINPLNQKETNEYVRSRLYRAGLETPCFTEKAIDEIFRYSKGTPRLINILCDNSLTIGYAMDKKKIDEKIIREAIDDMETGQRRLPESTRSPISTGQPRSSPPAEKPKIPYRIGIKQKETKRWGLSSLIFWVYVLLLSGILLLHFGFWSNQRQTFEPSSTTIINKPIPATKPVTFRAP
jgi:general secretion pathway protein A